MVWGQRNGTEEAEGWYVGGGLLGKGHWYGSESWY